jgi:PDZ domain-containing protein
VSNPDAEPTSAGARWSVRAVLGSMSRRVRTLLIAAVLFLVMLVLAVTLPVPYVILSPGPTYNTLGADSQGQTIIVIKGKKVNATSGNLNMTTVYVSTGSVSVFSALSAWLQHDEAVIPRSSVYTPGQSQQQADQENTKEFVESQDNAVAAASCELGYPKKFGIVEVLSTSAAKKLTPADLIDTLDGQPAHTEKSLTSKLAKLAPGTKVTLGITRAGKPKTVSLTLGPPPKQRSGGSIGIVVGPVCQLPFTVDLGLANQIGGPSAGMMFALGIMDKVGKVNLTGGKFIAGTGTIDTSGAVGAIGGIQLKMIAARNAGATVFLAPAGNCADVRGAIPGGLDVVKVSSLHDAVQDLQDLQAGKPVPHC